MRRFILPLGISIILLICASTFVSSAVPGSISYQGKLTDSSGQPVSDGSHSLVFKLYVEGSGTLPPVWSSSAISVTTTGGVFTTSFSAPSTVFDTANLWLETAVNGATLSPRTKLESVPFSFKAAHADSADTVPDGSITAVKLAADVAYMRAPFLTGIKSGLPEDTKLIIYIDDHRTDPPAVLAEPCKVEFSVIEQADPTSPWPSYQPGQPGTPHLVLRRPYTNDKTWYQWAYNGTGGTFTRHDVVLELVNRESTLGRWTGRQGIVTSYKAKLADDGRPVEEVTFSIMNLEHGTFNIKGTPIPSGSGLQVGFTSGQPLTSSYTVTVDGTSLPAVVVASDLAFKSYETYVNGQIQPILKARADRFTLRQSPKGAYLPQWFFELMQGNWTPRNVMKLSLQNKDEPIWSISYANPWPCSYTLKLADDGLPVEEYEIAVDRVIPEP